MREKKIESHLRDHESLNLARVRDMGANAEINHGSTSINGSRCAVRNF